MPIAIKAYLVSCLSVLSGSTVSVAQIGFNQSAPQSAGVDSMYQLRKRLFADSLQHVQDSLEVDLLRSTQSYQQIERLLTSLSPNSQFLDSLPSVLPVDLPIEAFRVVSPFGIRQHPILKKSHLHGGVDVKARTGTSVKATAAGFVSQVGFDEALGVFVRLQHAFGFETVYGHLKGYCVKPGQRIEVNEEIGRVGQTGLTTGPHLHYVIKKNGSAIDPFFFCFLLRRRLWLYEKSKTDGISVPDGTNLSSKGE